MHNWSLIWWKIHSLNSTIELYFGGLFPSTQGQCWEPRGAAESGSLWGTTRAVRPGWQQHTCVGGRESTCLVPLRWEPGFAAATVRMEMCWPCKHCLLHRLLSSCEVRAPLLTSGMAASRQSCAVLECGCWQRQLQGEQDSLYAVSIPSLLPPDLLWAEIGMSEFTATSPLHREACYTQFLLLQKLLLPDLYELQAVKVIWRAGRNTAQKYSLQFVLLPLKIS